VNEPRGQSPSSVTGQQQHVTRTRIGQAAMEVVALRGSTPRWRRSPSFGGEPTHHLPPYVSHDRLIAATVKDMFEACGRYPIEGLPRLVDDLDGWIEACPAASTTSTTGSSVWR